MIMIKSLDKILNFYYNNMHNSPLQYYTKYKLLHKFNIHDVNTNLIKDILLFSSKHNFKIVNSFMQSLLDVKC